MLSEFNSGHCLFIVKEFRELKITKNYCHLNPSFASIPSESQISSKSPMACVKFGKMTKYEPLKFLICHILEVYASLGLVPKEKSIICRDMQL